MPNLFVWRQERLKTMKFYVKNLSPLRGAPLVGEPIYIGYVKLICNTLGEHGVGDFNEAGDIRASDKVTFATVIL